MNRKFISQKYQHQYKDGSGTPYKAIITAENTTLTVVEKFQGPWRYDGDRGNKILFTISFEDTGLSICSKVKDHLIEDKAGYYAKYALASMDVCENYEEYYKAALLITKNSLKRQMDSFKEAEAKFKKTGYWPYPYNTDVKMYKNSYKLDKKTFESIDITEDDLDFFKAFVGGRLLHEINVD